MICLFFEDIYVLINMAILPTFLSNAISIIGLLYYRKKKPNFPRPVKINLIIPIIYLVFTIGIILITFIRIPKHSAICNQMINSKNFEKSLINIYLGIFLILCGIPVFYLTKIANKSKKFQSYSSNFIR